MDPQFHLYPSVRLPVQVRDEIELKKQSIAKQIEGNPPVVSVTYTMGLSKTVSGSYVNNLDIPTGLLPGNFGVRCVDNMMPSSLSDVYCDRSNTKVVQFNCENTQLRVPELLDAPDAVDYLTDDESDDNQGFDLKVPELGELINQFEADDETLAKAEEAYKEHLTDLKARGFEKEVREEIKQTRMEKTELLDTNISAKRSY